MKKIIRILGLIQIIRQKKYYPGKVRRELTSTLLHLEYKSYRKKGSHEVQLKLFNYNIHAFGYENLRLLFTEIFVHEEYQYFANIQDGTIVADCGANIGIATLYFKWRFPGCIIHCFEPDPMAFLALSKNVKNNNLQQVFLHNVAVMGEEGSLPFYVSQAEQASLMMSTVANRMNERTIEVPAIDFSVFVKENNPTVLKIDIEGAEKNVFDKLISSGAINNLQQIIMEYHHKIEGQPSNLSGMLGILEKTGFEYNLITQFNAPGKFQDILIYAYRPAVLSN
ncbi:MAG: FkbM family methyltransferase [Chitinophagaceae bacterium]|nr:FkbM family methyltransferase [Chitinophagaceae bacterium]